MNRHDNITLNCPNLPVLPPSTNGDIPFGVFFDSPTDKKCPLEPGVATIRSQDMYLPNFSIREFEASFSQNVVFKNLDADGTHLLGSCLFLEANMKSYLAGRSAEAVASHSPEVTSFSRSQNIKYDPNNEYVHSMPAGSRIHYMHVTYQYEYFSRLLPENETWAEWLKNKIEKRERILGERAKPLSLAQLRAIETVLDCPLSGKLGEMMLETAITQVILFQLDHLFSSGEGSPAPQTYHRNREIVFELKEYLSQTFLDDHSIASLSRQFGMNANQLMSMFKENFGKSIFEFICQCRMQHAVHLLMEKHNRIADVSRELGYKNPNHFSTAFKRVYGVIPSEFRYQAAY